ncbi:MAG: Rrf2 family transcriptional regulator [Thermoguttaceae bacterium]
MRITAKMEYACLAIFELAKEQSSCKPVRIQTISRRHQVSSRFLVHILRQLKEAGLVASIRGVSGGYRLISQPDEMTLGQVMSLVEGPIGSRRKKIPTSDFQQVRCVLHKTWETAEQKRQEYLYGITFADLIAQCPQPTFEDIDRLITSPAPQPVPESQMNPMKEDCRREYA